MDRLDCVVIGGGVVGLAVARSLALASREVVVLEAEPKIGMHASSRNSEVIHAGLHYPDDSLKGRLCVAGKEMMYRYCQTHHIAFARIGKLIVASSDAEIGRLYAIDEQAKKNGVTDLQLLDSAAVADMEPEVECRAALLSPSTGIVDTHQLMVALHGEIEANGGLVMCNSKVATISIADNGFHLAIEGTECENIVCRTLINSAGLWAQDLASFGECTPPKVYLAKGHYYSYQGRSPFAHLIYPVPAGGGLGIHATNDLSGCARFGPDVSWVDTVDYKFDDSNKEAFAGAIRRYFPGLDEDRLLPAYTGIRPKLVGAGGSVSDFVIQGEAGHGVPELVNMFGIESPGLTSSLAIGEHVKEILL